MFPKAAPKSCYPKFLPKIIPQSFPTKLFLKAIPQNSSQNCSSKLLPESGRDGSINIKALNNRHGIAKRSAKTKSLNISCNLLFFWGIAKINKNKTTKMFKIIDLYISLYFGSLWRS
jgi:hypothetical protein